jgi:hypothetical protein
VSDQSWTVETICEALGTPAARKRFLGEINRAPVHEIVTVFAKWQTVAASMTAAADRGRELARIEAESGELPGEWIDVTDRIQREAANARSRGIA